MELNHLNDADESSDDDTPEVPVVVCRNVEITDGGRIVTGDNDRIADSDGYLRYVGPPE